jgi:hypothetical protein
MRARDSRDVWFIGLAPLLFSITSICIGASLITVVFSHVNRLYSGLAAILGSLILAAIAIYANRQKIMPQRKSLHKAINAVIITISAWLLLMGVFMLIWHYHYGNNGNKRTGGLSNSSKGT